MLEFLDSLFVAVVTDSLKALKIFIFIVWDHSLTWTPVEGGRQWLKSLDELLDTRRFSSIPCISICVYLEDVDRQSLQALSEGELRAVLPRLARRSCADLLPAQPPEYVVCILSISSI